jgi:hypothetical protein
MSWCPNCGHQVPIPLPVEPLYDSDVAALLIPTTRDALLALLRRHKADLPPPSYRIWRRVRRRLISATEIKWARARLVHHSTAALSRRTRHAKQDDREAAAGDSST